MAEYIVCRNCDSPDCKGCNLKNLETMLNSGKFDCLMNENHCINPSADAVPVDTVAKMFCDFTGDSCACDFNDNDEWLSEVCELKDECPYPKDRLGCWKQYIKHFVERKE